MANDALRFLPDADPAAAIARRKISPVDAVKAVLDAIDEKKTLNAWVTVDADAALKAARAAERAAMRRGARLGPLHGVPFGVKDLVITKGVRTTFGTPLYRDNVPTEDAPSVARMKAAGGIMIGKTNTPTFGWVGVTDNLIFGLTRNPYSLPAERVDYVKALKGSLKGLRVAYSETLGLAPAVDPEVRNATATAARVFRELGCRVEATNQSWASPWEPWRVIFLGGIAARLAPHLDRKKEIDAGLLAIVEESLAWPPAKYVQAWVDRLAWCAKASAFFERYALLPRPTVPSPPLPHAILSPDDIDGVKVGREASSIFTYPFNLTGQPAASVPCGFTKDGLPIGLQIVGRRFDDVTVLRASAAFETARPWMARRPAFS